MKVIAVSVCFCMFLYNDSLSLDRTWHRTWEDLSNWHFTTSSSLGDVETLDMHYIDALISAVFVRHIHPYPAMDDDSDEPLFQKLMIPRYIYIYIIIYVHIFIYTLIHSIYP